MTREEAKAKLKNFADHCYPNEEFLMAIDALEQITKIADIVDGTIGHLEYDDAMDMLYEIKGVIK